MGMWMLNMQLNADKGVVWSSKSLKIGKTMYIGFFFKYLVWAHKTKCICIYMRNAYAYAYICAHEKISMANSSSFPHMVSLGTYIYFKTELFKLCRRPSLQRIVDSSFYSTMENAMGAKKPREFYDNSPTVTKVLFTIIKALPRRMADKARLKLMFLPEFQRS